MAGWLELIGAAPPGGNSFQSDPFASWDAVTGQGTLTPEQQHIQGMAQGAGGQQEGQYTRSYQDTVEDTQRNDSINKALGFQSGQGVGGAWSSDAFVQDASGNWVPNQSNSFLNSWMNTADRGVSRSGLDALMNYSRDWTNNNTPDYGTGSMWIGGNSLGLGKSTTDALYKQLGIDPNAPDAMQQLENRAKNFVYLEGMTGEGDNKRGGTAALFERMEDGGWLPVYGQQGNIREKGNFWKENDYLPAYALATIASMGAASAAAAGAGAGAAAGGGSAAGAGGAAGAAGAAGQGGLLNSLGSLVSGGTGGLGTSALGSAANAVGLGSQWAALPGWAQTALGGALQGAGTSALTGGDIGKGALLGGLGGGLGAGVSSGLKDIGVSGLANSALTGAATGAAKSAVGGGNALTGGLMGALTSGVGAGVKDFTGLGSLGQLASQATGYGANYALQNAFKDEDQQQVQSQLSNLRQLAASKGISEQQLNYVLSTPQGQAAFRAMVQEAGPGKLRSLLG